MKFDPDSDTLQNWLRAVEAFAGEHLRKQASAPTSNFLSEKTTPREIPDEPISIDEALKIVTDAANIGINTTSPGYFGFIPAGGLYASALADFIAGVINRYTGLVETAPELVQLERDVARWLCRKFYGDAPAAGASLTSGGTLATLAAVVAARDRRPLEDLRHAVGYASQQAHHCVAEAFRVAGLPPENLVKVPVDAHYRMDLALLKQSIAEDRRKGRKPFIVVGTAGSTITGAIDPLSELADLCAGQDLWFHVDAAYGGAFMLCEQGRRLLRGIEQADTITFDPHKGLFLPYGTGCLLFKSAATAGTKQWDDASYLDDWTSITPDQFQLELTRPYRGLRLWLVLALYGARSFEDALAAKLVLAADLHKGLLSIEGIEVVCEPQLSIVVFRLARRSGEGVDDWNKRNIAFLKSINDRQRSFLTRAKLPTHSGGNAVVVRACVLSHRTDSDNVARLLEDVGAAVRAQT